MAKIVLNNEESDQWISTQALGAVLSHKDDPKQGPKHDKKSGEKSPTRTVRDGSLSPGFCRFSDTIFGSKKEYSFGTTPITNTSHQLNRQICTNEPRRQYPELKRKRLTTAELDVSLSADKKLRQKLTAVAAHAELRLALRRTVQALTASEVCQHDKRRIKD